jgi:diacylglycerol diphosphate phosphatase / phosphatidate phosphatase
MPLTKKPGAIGAIARFWSRTYAADYVTLGVLWVLWFMVLAEPQLLNLRYAWSR